MANDPKYERTDLSFWGAVAFAGFVVLLLGGVALVSGGLARQLQQINRGSTAVSPIARLKREPPEPRLQVSEANDMADLRNKEDAVLNSYAWVDAPKGIVRIPIERAMDLIAREQP